MIAKLEEYDFNPRSYKRSDSEKQEEKQYYRLFQSTLLQEERLMEVIEIRQKKIISIHAPTRGATTPSISSTLSLTISIHAPTRGATVLGSMV